MARQALFDFQVVAVGCRISRARVGEWEMSSSVLSQLAGSRYLETNSNKEAYGLESLFFSELTGIP